MNVVFLSPHFPPQFHLFCRALLGRGARALGVGDAPPERVELPVWESLSDYVFVPDMERYDGLLRAAGYLTWRYGRIDHIDSLNEHWLGVEARLREDFNVRGM